MFIVVWFSQLFNCGGENGGHLQIVFQGCGFKPSNRIRTVAQHYGSLSKPRILGHNGLGTWDETMLKQLLEGMAALSNAGADVGHC